MVSNLILRKWMEQQVGKVKILALSSLRAGKVPLDWCCANILTYKEGEQGGPSFAD